MRSEDEKRTDWELDEVIKNAVKCRRNNSIESRLMKDQSIELNNYIIRKKNKNSSFLRQCRSDDDNCFRVSEHNSDKTLKNENSSQKSKFLGKLKKSFLLGKRELKNSKEICNDCKGKLLINEKAYYRIIPLMFKQTEFEKLKNKSIIQSLDSRSVSYFKLEKLNLKEFIKMRHSSLELENSFKFNRFNNLKEILIKLLNQDKIDEHELAELSLLEKKLLILFIKKKKFSNHKYANLTQEYFNHIQENPKGKRIEENMKFIFKKVIRFLKIFFQDKIYFEFLPNIQSEFSNLTPEKKIDYSFYSYYFYDVAKEIRQPLEKFFHPRLSKAEDQEKQKFIPKTISRLYINFIKMSSLFVNDMNIYLQKFFEYEIKKNIKNKIEKMCFDWEVKSNKMNDDVFYKEVETYFTLNKKCKLAWSLFEGKFAQNQILKLVKNESSNY